MKLLKKQGLTGSKVLDRIRVKTFKEERKRIKYLDSKVKTDC